MVNREIVYSTSSRVWELLDASTETPVAPYALGNAEVVKQLN
jgi:hypothetical protein